MLQCLADDVQSRAGSLYAGDLEDALGRLRLLAGLLRESDVLASTVSAILGSIVEIVLRDVDSYVTCASSQNHRGADRASSWRNSYTKDTLLNVLQACGCHIAELDDSYVRSEGLPAAFSSHADVPLPQLRVAAGTTQRRFDTRRRRGSRRTRL